MKKFMLVLMAILMVVSMPVAAFATPHCDDCPDWSQENLAFLYHPCYVGTDAKVDMVGDGSKKIVNCFVTSWDEENAVIEEITDKFDPSFLIDGKSNTGTYLPVAKQTRLRFAFGHPQEFSQIKVVVNGKGELNPGTDSVGPVFKKTDFEFTVQVVVKDELGGNILYKSEPVSAKGKTEIVFDVEVPAGTNAQGKTFDVIIVDAATSTTIPRLWDIVVMEKAYDGAFDAGEYVHDFVEVVDKKSTTVTPGTAHMECSRCATPDGNGSYDLPLMPADQLTGGGILGLGDVKITEELGIFDANGKPIEDIDGNKLGAEALPGSDPKSLFDGISDPGGLWNAGKSFWAVGVGGKLTIEFAPVAVNSLNVEMVLNAWPCVGFNFYNGDTLVGSYYGNWGKNPDGSPQGNNNDRWTQTTWSPTKFDLAEICDFKGETIDKIVITVEHTNGGTPTNYCKLSEIEIGVHKHVYTTEQALAGVNGGAEDPCKWTYTGTCVECEHVTEGVVAYLHDLETTVVKEATCGDGLSTDKCKTEGCGYENVEYVVKGTGEHDFSTFVVQNKYATCGAQGTATFVCSTCKTREDASVQALVGKKLAADLYGVYGKVAASGTVLTEDILEIAIETGAIKFALAATDSISGANLVINYNISADFDAEEFVVESVGAAPAGYHTFGWKNIVPSTYTVHGVDGGYCTVCGTEFKDTYKDADLIAPKEVRIANLGFSKRVADFNGIRATFKVNRESIKILTDKGYSVRIWIVATNEAGESQEVQIFGAGAKAWMDYTGKSAVVIKGADADEVITFTAKISVKDYEGEQIVFEELGATSYNEIA